MKKTEDKLDKVLKVIKDTNKLLPRLKAKIETLQTQNKDMYEALQELLQGNEVYHSIRKTGYRVAPSPDAVEKGIQALLKADGK